MNGALDRSGREGHDRVVKGEEWVERLISSSQLCIVGFLSYAYCCLVMDGGCFALWPDALM